MIHPLAESFSGLKDAELENKVQELSKKFFMAANNPAVQNQIILLLDMYKAELNTRRQKVWQEQYQKRDTDLDSLINVS
jgi:predicted transcriptional regulator of viral defense system